MNPGHEVEISRHAAARMKSRLGLNKKAQVRHVRKVRELGEFVGKTHVENDNVLYLGHRYIFKSHTLVTVVPEKTTWTDDGYIPPTRYARGGATVVRKRA